ncbi:hypothetical protein G6F65_023127 [Rhizopus arrhizus]|nr:hypothetical protein G6F65_023127 [Rhizopus arrhizus]
MQDDDPRRHLLHEVQIMLHQQAAQPVLVRQRRQHLADLRPLSLRQARRRLVQQHDARLQRQHHRQFQRLLLPV